ncbi:FAD-dependent oxidoreductase [Crossiella sp. CA198]|uniref:FAD-dependent oxidoreductase n=1 Tax=Crossiella sp. CA198 TaxID=3455607 RepID=UPI003F8CFB7E
MSRVVVVGAGPAGLAAAWAAASVGASVLLVDSGAAVGGQYRRQSGLRAARVPVHPLIEWLPETSVWAVETVAGRHRVRLQTGAADAPGRRMSTVDTAALVIATGAYDRVLPFPGWDLPGVYTAGAAQALAKGQGISVGRRVLVGGTGPFLLPVTRSLVEVGARVAEVVEANSVGSSWGWRRDPLGALGKVGELAGYGGMLARRRVPVRFGAAVVAAHGESRVEAVTVARLDREWRPVAGSERVVEVDAVCLGFGFTAQLELAVSAGCRIEDGAVAVDPAQRTSVAGVFAAGEVTGIAGAGPAAAEGTVAGYAAAARVGRAVAVPRDALRMVRAGRRFGRALATAYPVRSGWRDWVSADTVVCRCEEVRMSDLCAAVAQGALGMRAVKLVSRAGLGLCQGRICGRIVGELTGAPFTQNRPIAVPVRLRDLAAVEDEEES